MTHHTGLVVVLVALFPLCHVLSMSTHICVILLAVFTKHEKMKYFT